MNRPAISTEHQPETFQRWLKIATHFLCLGIIFILPDVVMSKHMGMAQVPWRFYSKSLVFVAVFYINYYLIIDRCLNRPHWVVRLAVSNLGLIIISLIIIYWLFIPPHKVIDAPVREHNMLEHRHVLRVITFIMRDTAMVILTVGLSVAMKLSDNWSRIISQRDQMLATQRQAELDSLKRQLNPHFLFNTLNSIYALIALSPDNAQKAVHHLSGLLRYVLYENAPTVPLADELNFVNNYVKLMSMRLGDTLPVKLNLDAGNKPDLHIAPLIFISPVENAFKYGNTGLPDAEITISITCSDSVVNCFIQNSTTEITEQKSDSGIGLINLQRRLNLIYGDRAEMNVCKTDSQYTFMMRIDLSEY